MSRRTRADDLVFEAKVSLERVLTTESATVSQLDCCKQALWALEEIEDECDTPE